jgi:predicted porin
VKFTGAATISPGWSAGYVLHIEAFGSDGLTTSQNNDNGVGVYTLTSGAAGTNSGVQVIQSYWFVKSDQLGKVSVGQQSQASDNTAILVDGSGSLVPANWVAYDVNSFQRRQSGTGANLGTWGGYCGNMGGSWGDCNGLTRNVVRYDSPSFGGFSVSASWGEDDMWDVAGRYSGEFSGVKVAVAAAYNEVTDEAFNGSAGPNGIGQYFQVGAYGEHVASGLWILGNYGNLDSDNGAGVNIGSSDTWYIKAGLRSRFNALGHTVFYGEYLEANGDGVLSGTAGASSETSVWGLGMVRRYASRRLRLRWPWRDHQLLS